MQTVHQVRRLILKVACGVPVRLIGVALKRHARSGAGEPGRLRRSLHQTAGKRKAQAESGINLDDNSSLGRAYLVRSSLRRRTRGTSGRGTASAAKAACNQIARAGRNERSRGYRRTFDTPRFFVTLFVARYASLAGVRRCRVYVAVWE